METTMNYIYVQINLFTKKIEASGSYHSSFDPLINPEMIPSREATLEQIGQYVHGIDDEGYAIIQPEPLADIIK